MKKLMTTWDILKFSPHSWKEVEVLSSGWYAGPISPLRDISSYQDTGPISPLRIFAIAAITQAILQGGSDTLQSGSCPEKASKRRYKVQAVTKQVLQRSPYKAYIL